MPQPMKIPEAKAAVYKEWKKLETIPAWQVDKMKSKKDVVLEAQRERGKKVHFATYEILFGFTLYWLCMNKTTFETTNSHSRLKTLVTRHVDQMVRTRNIKARNDRIGTGVVTKSQKWTKVSERKVGECSH